MKKLLIILTLTMMFGKNIQYEDVIHLKNGDLIKGEIIENVDASDGIYDNQVIVTWDETENTDSYKIYRDGIWLGIVSSSSNPEYIDYYIELETIHSYCIESTNECGVSDWMCDEGYGATGIGDVNDDDFIDVLDVVVLVNIIMGYTVPNEDEAWAADLNNDGQFNIQDIVLLVNIILG